MSPIARATGWLLDHAGWPAGWSREWPVALLAAVANAGEVEDRVRVAVYQRFIAEGVRIPFPTREIGQAGAGARIAFR